MQARARLQAAVAGSVFNELGVQLSQLGRMLQASKAFRVSLEMHEALVGEHSINLASPLSNLATVLTHLRRYREALLLQQRHVALLSSHLPPAHPRLSKAMHHVQVRHTPPRGSCAALVPMR